MKAPIIYALVFAVGAVAGAGVMLRLREREASVAQDRLVAAEARAAKAEDAARALRLDRQNSRVGAAASLPAEAGRPAVAKTEAAMSARDPRLAPGTVDLAAVRRQEERARQRVLLRYGPLLQQLGLDDDRREQLLKLLIDERQAPADIAASARQNGLDPGSDPATFSDLIAATRADLETQIQALLGDSGYAAYQEFDRTESQARLVSQLGKMIAGTEPLTPQQAAALESAMRASNTSRVSAKVLSDAATFLSPVQLQALRDLRAVQRGRVPR